MRNKTAHIHTYTQTHIDTKIYDLTMIDGWMDNRLVINYCAAASLIST